MTWHCHRRGMQCVESDTFFRCIPKCAAHYVARREAQHSANSLNGWRAARPDLKDELLTSAAGLRGRRNASAAENINWQEIENAGGRAEVVPFDSYASALSSSASAYTNSNSSAECTGLVTNATRRDSTRATNARLAPQECQCRTA